MIQKNLSHLWRLLGYQFITLQTSTEKLFIYPASSVQKLTMPTYSTVTYNIYSPLNFSTTYYLADTQHFNVTFSKAHAWFVSLI